MREIGKKWGVEYKFMEREYVRVYGKYGKRVYYRRWVVFNKGSDKQR